MQLVDTGDCFPGTEIDHKIEGNFASGKTGALVATIGTAAIGDGRHLSIVFAELGDGLAV